MHFPLPSVRFLLTPESMDNVEVFMEWVKNKSARRKRRHSSTHEMTVTHDGLLVINGQISQPVAVKVGHQYVRGVWTSRLNELVSKAKLEAECE